MDQGSSSKQQVNQVPQEEGENISQEEIKEKRLHQMNLNYLIEFEEMEIDTKISPLICACYLGRIELVKLLMENEQLDLDLASEDYGFTPLCIACLTANYEIVSTLIEYGAEVNKPNAFSQTPLFHCFTRLGEQINYFENKLISLKMCDLLLENGADINWIVDKELGYTILMQFSGNNIELIDREKSINLDVIKFLLERGADRTIKSLDGKDAYELAESHCNSEQVKLAIKTVPRIYKFQNKIPVLTFNKQIVNHQQKKDNYNNNNNTNNTNNTKNKWLTDKSNKVKESFSQLFTSICNK